MDEAIPTGSHADDLHVGSTLSSEPRSAAFDGLRQPTADGAKPNDGEADFSHLAGCNVLAAGPLASAAASTERQGSTSLVPRLPPGLFKAASWKTEASERLDRHQPPSGNSPRDPGKN